MHFDEAQHIGQPAVGDSLARGRGLLAGAHRIADDRQRRIDQQSRGLLGKRTVILEDICEDVLGDRQFGALDRHEQAGAEILRNMRAQDMSRHGHMQELMHRLVIGLALDEEGRHRASDGEIAGLGDLVAALVGKGELAVLDEPQDRKVGRILADMLARAAEEQVGRRALLDDRDRAHSLALGTHIDSRCILDPEIAAIIFLLALAAKHLLAFAIIALVQGEQRLGHRLTPNSTPARHRRSPRHTVRLVPVSPLGL